MGSRPRDLILIIFLGVYIMRTQELVNNMYQQLGGQVFSNMTGAKLTFMEGRDLEGQECDIALIIKLPASCFNIHKIKIVEMCLMFNDTYTFKFIKKGKKPFKVITDIYCDQVKDIFEIETNLLVSPYNRLGSAVVIGKNVI